MFTRSDSGCLIRGLAVILSEAKDLSETNRRDSPLRSE